LFRENVTYEHKRGNISYDRYGYDNANSNRETDRARETYHMTAKEIARLKMTSPYKNLNIITAIK